MDPFLASAGAAPFTKAPDPSIQCLRRFGCAGSRPRHSSCFVVSLQYQAIHNHPRRGRYITEFCPHNCDRLDTLLMGQFEGGKDTVDCSLRFACYMFNPLSGLCPIYGLRAARECPEMNDHFRKWTTYSSCNPRAFGKSLKPISSHVVGFGILFASYCFSGYRVIFVIPSGPAVRYSCSMAGRCPKVGRESELL